MQLGAIFAADLVLGLVGPVELHSDTLALAF